MKKNKIGSTNLIFLLLISLVIMTICCNSSFLYPFNDEADVSCFYTVARCMRSGKVLYRDIYEHKGLYLYFIYALASLVKAQNYIGIYIIESFCCYLFAVFSFMSVRKLIENDKISMLLTILTLTFTYTCIDVQECGYAEEFIIPLIAICIYFVVDFCNDNKEVWPSNYVFIIGIISAVIMWIKYTALGAIVGLLIYMILNLLSNKSYKELIRCSILYIFGFFVGSVPLILYFGLNNAFEDLVHVYFYNLLFVYKGGDLECSSAIERFQLSFMSPKRANNLFAESFFLCAMVLGSAYDIYFCVERRLSKYISAMFWVSALLLGAGILYHTSYQPIILWPFVIFPLISLYKVLQRVDEGEIKIYVNKVIELLNYKFQFGAVVCLLALILYGLGFLFNPYYIIFYILYIGLLYIVGNRISKSKLLSKKVGNNNYIIKYLIPSIFLLFCGFIEMTVLIETNIAKCSAVSTMIIFLVEDWDSAGDIIIKKVGGVLYSLRNKFNKHCMIYSLLFVLTYCFVFTNNIGYMFWNYEDTPQYNIAKYIEESGIENPIIYHYEVLDTGIFNILDLYPQMKYYGYYNINLPEIDETVEEYVNNRKADFVITTKNNINYSLIDGYNKVYTGKFYKNNEYMFLYLYERKEIK